MSTKRIRRIPPSAEIKSMTPINDKIIQIKAKRDKELKDIFTGDSNKFLVLIGPCSADNEEAVMDYIHRLAKVNEQVSDKLFIMPRIYTNKPRTTGEGYKGMVHQPDPEKAPDMLEGLLAIRRLHIRSIEETGFTAADEMLYPTNWKYMDDILSYVAVGARSVEDQHHRLTVSGMDVPAGMKNPMSGDLSVMMNSVIAGQAKHRFLLSGWEVQTDGNPFTHTILRGAVNFYGQNIANYHYEDMIQVVELYKKLNLQYPACIVDANHSNSGKQWDQQPRIIQEVLHNRSVNSELHNLIKGVMVESYIEDGAQAIGNGCYGKSITDPCLGWEKTEKLLYDMANSL